MTLAPPAACPFLGCYIVGPHWHGTASMMPPVETIHGPHCGKAIEERDILRRRVEERAHACANVEAERDRLRRELAERNAVCQAHMENRYNAERERDRLGGEAVELLSALRNLWRIADDCGRCTNMDATERAFEVLAKHVRSASPAELSATGNFSPVAEPSSPDCVDCYRERQKGYNGCAHHEEAKP